MADRPSWNTIKRTRKKTTARRDGYRRAKEAFKLAERVRRAREPRDDAGRAGLAGRKHAAGGGATRGGRRDPEPRDAAPHRGGAGPRARRRSPSGETRLALRHRAPRANASRHRMRG